MSVSESDIPFISLSRTRAFTLRNRCSVGLCRSGVASGKGMTCCGSNDTAPHTASRTRKRGSNVAVRAVTGS